MCLEIQGPKEHKGTIDLIWFDHLQRNSGNFGKSFSRHQKSLIHMLGQPLRPSRHLWPKLSLTKRVQTSYWERRTFLKSLVSIIQWLQNGFLQGREKMRKMWKSIIPTATTKSWIQKKMEPSTTYPASLLLGGFQQATAAPNPRPFQHRCGVVRKIETPPSQTYDLKNHRCSHFLIFFHIPVNFWPFLGYPSDTLVAHDRDGWSSWWLRSGKPNMVCKLGISWYHSVRHIVKFVYGNKEFNMSIVSRITMVYNDTGRIICWKYQKNGICLMCVFSIPKNNEKNLFQ